MKKTYWSNGDYLAICDVCGHKFKASKLKERWDGLKVCSQDWEQRHPQEFLRVIPESNKLIWTRPESTDTFTSQSYPAQCTIESVFAYPSIAIAGCAIAGKLNNGIL